MLFLMCAFFWSCTQDKKTLTGDIRGNIFLTDQYDHDLQDKSGITVIISNDDFADSMVTSSPGTFLMSSVPYGQYTIHLSKPGYLQYHGGPYLLSSQDEFYHTGGASPTMVSYTMYQIPDYVYHLDSATYDNGILNVFGSGPDQTILSNYEFYYTIAVCFVSDQPDVSADNFAFYFYGDYLYPSQGAPAVSFYFGGSFSSGDFPPEHSYIRLYPLSKAQDFWGPLLPEAMGKPSNVITCTFSN